MNNIFYVYIYLDPRKPGRYVYGDYCFLYEPFYVGKGKGRRYKQIYSNRSRYFKNIINNIKKRSLEPIIIKIKINLIEKQSHILEFNLIKLIGRKDLDNGPLINFTNGGEGISGLVFTKEHRKKLSNTRINLGLSCGKRNPMFGVHRFGKDSPFFGKTHNEKSKRKMSEKKKGENAPKSKLVKNDIIEIRKYLNNGLLSLKEIGDMFNVSYQTIQGIRDKRYWSHIKEEKNG